MKIALLRTLPILALLSANACAPPSNVPTHSKRHWSIKDGYSWTWTRPAAAGCLSWLANEEWVSVHLLVDKSCESISRNTGFSDDKGLSYTSFEDALIFQGYWPWSPEIHSQLYVYDEKGNVSHTLPCPGSLNETQLKDMRNTATAALNSSLTTSERRVIRRIVTRLSSFNGKPLSVLQSGCSDWQEGVEHYGTYNPWKID